MLGGDADPAQVGELRDASLAAESAHAAGLGAAEGHLRLVLHGGAVDVTDSRVDALGHRQRRVDVAAEYGGRKAVLAVIGQFHGVLGIAGAQHADDRAEGLLAVDAHALRHAIDHGGLEEGAAAAGAAGDHLGALGGGIG